MANKPHRRKGVAQPRQAMQMKKKEKLRKGSSTSGRSKGENCKASPKERTMAKRGRSYRWNGYETWCKKMEAKRKKYGG